MNWFFANNQEDDMLTLQSQAEIDVFDIIKNITINLTGLPRVDVLTSETEIEIKAKIQSKTWTIVNIYDNIILCPPPLEPCLIVQPLMYVDYTSDPSYSYTIALGLLGPAPCDKNPIEDIQCVDVSRTDIYGTIDDVIPSNIIYEAINKLSIPSSPPKRNRWMWMYGFGACGLGVGLMYIMRRRHRKRINYKGVSLSW